MKFDFFFSFSRKHLARGAFSIEQQQKLTYLCLYVLRCIYYIYTHTHNMPGHGPLGKRRGEGIVVTANTGYCVSLLPQPQPLTILAGNRPDIAALFWPFLRARDVSGEDGGRRPCPDDNGSHDAKSLWAHAIVSLHGRNRTEDGQATTTRIFRPNPLALIRQSDNMLCTTNQSRQDTPCPTIPVISNGREIKRTVVGIADKIKK